MEEYLLKPLRKAVRFLENAEFRYAIVGGLALAQWGIVRVTRDIDFRILTPNLDYTAMRHAIRKAFPQSARPQLERHPFVVAVEIDHVIVDFLLAGPGYEEQVVERAMLMDIGGWEAWICSAEDLVIQKVYSQREKDWLDVEALLIAHWNNLNLAYMQSWVEQFAEAMDAPEMSERYQALVAKVKRLAQKRYK